MEIQWALVMFTVVSGTGAWLFAWSVIQNLAGKSPLPSKAETIASIVLLAVGGGISVLHLKHVDRIFEALNHPTSGIFIEAALIGISCVFLAVYLVMLVRKANPSATRAVGIAGAAVCILLSYECGASYMMESRQAWMSVSLPLGYCLSAAAAGAGANMVAKALAKGEAESVAFSGLPAVIGGAAAAVCSLAFCIHASSFITASRNGAALWVALLFAALAVTVAAGFAGWKKPGRASALGCAALCGGVIACIALRVAMWLLGTPVLDFFLMPLE